MEQETPVGEHSCGRSVQSECQIGENERQTPEKDGFPRRCGAGVCQFAGQSAREIAAELSRFQGSAGTGPWF